MPTRITRHNLSGGVLGQQLATRSDLEHYHKANHQQENFLATPFGGIVRRPPAKWLTGIPSRELEFDAAPLLETGTPVMSRGFKFVYSSSERYSVVFIEYENDSQTKVESRALIYDDAGVLKSDFIIPYLGSEFLDIDDKQVNDVIMFTHGNHRPARIIRTGDTDWSFESLEISGGPLLSANRDRGIEFTLSGNKYDNTTTYNTGDLVQLGGAEVAITAAEWIVAYVENKNGQIRQHYYMWLTCAGHTLAVGDIAYIEELVNADGHRFDASFEIRAVSGDRVAIQTGYYEYKDGLRDPTSTKINYYPTPVTFAASIIGEGSGSGFYQSLGDGNTGNTPPNDTYWKRVYTGIPLTITSNQDAFTVEDELRTMGLSLQDGALSISNSFPRTGGVTDPVPMRGVFTVQTTGVWGGSLIIELSQDNGEYWEPIATLQGLEGTKNHIISRTVARVGGLIRGRHVGWGSFAGDSNCIFDIIQDDTQTITMKLDTFIDARNMSVIIEGPLAKAFTSYKWALGAFGGSAGYPERIVIHEERLVMGGTRLRQFEFYGSEVNDWTNFKLSSLETGPVIFRIQADNVRQIKWLLSKSNRLYIGTDAGEYVATTPDKDTVISGINPPRITLITPYGSSNQKALAVHNEIVHVVGDRKTVRAIAEKEYTQSEISKSLTIFSPDITGEGINEMILQRNPYSSIWALRENGDVAQFTYDIENQIMGWSNVSIFGADIRSIWDMPDDDNIDEVFFIDQRDDVMMTLTGAAADPDAAGNYFSTTDYEPDVIDVSGSGFAQGEMNGRYARLATGIWRSTVDVQARIVATGYPSPPFFTMTYDSFGVVFENMNATLTVAPHKGGWSRGQYGVESATVPELEYTVMKHETNDRIWLESVASPWFIKDGTSLAELYINVSGKYGTYLDTGAGTDLGTASAVPFHIEKFDYSDDVLADLNESSYDSLVEFTSLIQSQGRLERDTVRCVRVIVYLVESQSGEVSADGGVSWQALSYDDDELFTGYKEVRVNSGNVQDLRVMVRTSGTRPFELIGVAVDVEQQAGD